MRETEQFWGTIDFHSIFPRTMEVRNSPYYENKYRFGTTWGWVNGDRIFIFGWTIPLSCYQHSSSVQQEKETHTCVKQKKNIQYLDDI